MNRNSANASGLLAVLAVFVLSPLIFLLLILWLFAGLALYILVWLLWYTRGKDILFVYSDSPDWREYIEQQIIPPIKARAVILNWSDRRHWLRSFSLSSLVFRYFGGSREFNPLAIYFRPLRPHHTFRFWLAFKDRKHGRSETLMRIEREFFDHIARKRQTTEY